MTQTAPPTGLVPQNTLRARARSALGGYSPLLRWYRSVRPRWLWLRMNPLGKATRRYINEHGLVVRHGPFEGMRYPHEAVGRVGFIPAKMLGTYEPELAPFFARLGGYDLFVDVGSGEGYYCVGVARIQPDTQVIGYETDDSERQLCKRTAAVNGVRVEVRGTANHDELNSLPPGRLLLMCDVEGYEYDLIDPESVPRLRDATLVVEVHPAAREGVLEVLIERFAQTHRIETTYGEPKVLELHPELADWPEQLATLAVTEGRPHFPVWLTMTPARPEGT